MFRNFALSCDLTHVQKCAIQTLARDITGSRSGLSCFIIAIELSQARYYAVMKGVFSFSFQLADLGEIPYVISAWHRFWGKEFSKLLKYMWGLLPWKRRRKYIFVQLNLNLLLKYIMVTDHLKYNFTYNALFGGWSRLCWCWPVGIGFGPVGSVEAVTWMLPVPWECGVPCQVPGCLTWGGHPDRVSGRNWALGLCWCFTQHCCMWKTAVLGKVASESQWWYAGHLRVTSEPLAFLQESLRLLRLPG